MKGKILIAVFLILIFFFYITPVSALLTDKGVKINKAVNGNEKYYVSVEQHTHYFYDERNHLWLASTNVVGAAYQKDSLNQWTDATGSFGIYFIGDGMSRQESETFGTNVVVYSTPMLRSMCDSNFCFTYPISSKFESTGLKTLYNYDEETFGITDLPEVDDTNTYFGVMVVGYIDDFIAISTTQAER